MTSNSVIPKVFNCVFFKSFRNENRFVVFNLPGLGTINRTEYATKAMNKIVGVLTSMEVEARPVFVRYITSRSPIYEVQMPSVGNSVAVRQRFIQLVKAKTLPTALAGVSFANCMTPATRVRISILRVSFLIYVLFAVICSFLLIF